MSSSRGLTTTSYALLGLLAIRPWSTYELTRQMEWSLSRFWPRAKSKLYEEPKKLERLGLASARTETRGQRTRTVYTITASGRRALRVWQTEPSTGFALEAEPLLRVFLADQGTRADTMATLATARAWAVERNEGNLAAGRAFLAGGPEFQARAAPTMLVGAFLTDFYKLVADWADWASKQVADWPPDPAAARPNHDEQRAIVARAEWSETATHALKEARRL
jgi:PadR family transcriptional regulator, regulatory protein AphA